MQKHNLFHSGIELDAACSIWRLELGTGTQGQIQVFSTKRIDDMWHHQHLDWDIGGCFHLNRMNYELCLVAGQDVHVL